MCKTTEDALFIPTRCISVEVREEKGGEGWGLCEINKYMNECDEQWKLPALFPSGLFYVLVKGIHVKIKLLETLSSIQHHPIYRLIYEV